MFAASSQATWAEIIGLRGNATAIPVENSSRGAAMAAAVIIIHGTCPASVNNMPEKPACSSPVASSAVRRHDMFPAIRSNFMSDYPLCV